MSRVAVLAPFSSFDSTYSLAHVVCDQVRALRWRGHAVEVWCMESARFGDGMTADLADSIRPCLPWPSDKALRPSAIGAALHREYLRFGPRWIIAHDCCFQSGYADFGRAIHENAHRTTGATWLHWTHSAIGNPNRHVEPEEFQSRRLPARHFLVYPNESKVGDAQQFFRLSRERVFSCPNPRDPRTFGGFSAEAWRVSRELDLLRRDVVQVYPFCMTRAVDKGVPVCAAVFDALKRRGRSVCLILCGANAAGRDAEIEAIRAAAPGLGPDELVFMHERGFPGGVPNPLVSELMRLSTLFFFPTKAEACPLVMAEAAMAGCLLALNANVPALREYAPQGAVLLPLEAHGCRVEVRTAARTVRPNPEDSLRPLVRTRLLRPEDGYAEKIDLAMSSCPAVEARRHAFRTFGLEAVGARLDGILREAERRRLASRTGTGWHERISSKTLETSHAGT